MTDHPGTQISRDISELSKDERIQLAITAVHASGLKPDGLTTCLSLREAAKLYDVPRGTLTDRYNGVRTRAEAHEHEQLLSTAQEAVVVDWIKVMAKRGIPMTPSMVRDHVASITGGPVGESWVERFKKRHPDLKVKWTTSLEKCRAKCLNPTLVNEFYDLLEEIIKQYSIVQENVYNMDEKGIQLGVGKKVAAFVDRDQKDLYSVEDGNRELVTVIEAISADGNALPPSVIFQGVKRDAEWGRNNPCHASVSVSKKGWTDQELGRLWIERDFEPASAKRNTTNGFRLLILDGHNSHLTYEFCKFAEEHHIVVICLPSHTTHALQPCDVGVFGPLDSAWKAEVVKSSQQYLAITKYNLLEHYDNARKRALKPSTIVTAFTRTGIWPLNRLALDPQLFEPSKNTTTQSSQPLPARLPQILIPIPGMPLQSDDPTLNSAQIQHYKIPVPDPLHHTASRKDLRNENTELRNLLNAAGIQLEKDFAQLKLMDGENERLRKVAFAKEEKRMRKKELTTVHPRHMTDTEMLEKLAQGDWKKKMKDVHQEAVKVFQGLRTAIDQHYKDLDDQAKAAEKERKRQEVAAQRAEKAALVAAEKARKAAEREVKRLENAAGRARGRRCRGRAVLVRGSSGRGRGRGRAEVESDGTDNYEEATSNNSEESLQDGGNDGTQSDVDRLIVAEDVVSVRGVTLETHESIERPRPKPRPKFRAAPSIEEDSSGNEEQALLHIRSRRRGPVATGDVGTNTAMAGHIIDDSHGQIETAGHTKIVDPPIAGPSNLRRSARQQR